MLPGTQPSPTPTRATLPCRPTGPTYSPLERGRRLNHPVVVDPNGPRRGSRSDLMSSVSVHAREVNQLTAPRRDDRRDLASSRACSR